MRTSAVGFCLLAAACGGDIGVTTDRLIAARADSANWLTYSGAYDGQRHSLLAQINRTNVKDLVQQWEYPMETGHPVETSPLVVNGTMYLTRPPNDIVALDAATGKKRWEYDWKLPDGVATCCGLVNRGLAILGDVLFMGTLDAYVVAVSARTGDELWRVKGAEWREGYRITSAPLVVGNLVVVGYALNGADWHWTEPGSPPLLRGRIDAFDASTGALKWRVYTTPIRGEPGSETWQDSTWTVGGGSTWLTGSYDAELGLIYWGVGAPSAYSYGHMRPGDDLYTNSVLAIDGATGSLKWYFQFTPHDVNDWDAAQIPVLVDIEIGGRERKTLITANRNGFFYVLDRVTGEFLLARPFARQNWVTRIDERGRPVLTGNIEATVNGFTIAPPSDGATSWWSPSFSPRSGLFYVNTVDATETVTLVNRPNLGPTIERHRNTETVVTMLRAIDPRTGEIRWEHERPPATAGILTTAGDLLFSGNTTHEFIARDAQTGERLWRIGTSGWVHSAPITYLADGRQFVAIGVSKGIHAFAFEKKDK